MSVTQFKSVVTAMRFTVDDKHLLKMDERKKYVENACSRCFWQKMKSWWGIKTLISARSLTLLIFAVQWALCGWPQHGH